jgi:hypothetical protein
MIRKITSLLFVVVLSVFLSCSSDVEINKLSPEQIAIQDLTTIDAYLNDATSLTTAALSQPSNADLSGAGQTGITFSVNGDSRFNGATLKLRTTVNSTAQFPRGEITIDFGSRQSDPLNTVRSGKITITYTGQRFSEFLMTFDNYSVNGVKLEGIRTVDLFSSGSVSAGGFTIANRYFSIKDENTKATFSDGTSITRPSNHYRTWILSTDANGTIDKNQWEVESITAGVTRDSKSYNVTVTRKLIYRTLCAYGQTLNPSEGEARLILEGNTIMLNYGASAAPCDDIVAITTNGSTEDLKLNK